MWKKIGLGIVGVLALIIGLPLFAGTQVETRTIKLSEAEKATVRIRVTATPKPTTTLLDIKTQPAAPAWMIDDELEQVLPVPPMLVTIVPDESLATPSSGNAAACWHFRSASRDFGDGLLTEKGYIQGLKKVHELAKADSQIGRIARTAMWTFTSTAPFEYEKADIILALGTACADAGYLVFPGASR